MNKKEKYYVSELAASISNPTPKQMSLIANLLANGKIDIDENNNITDEADEDFYDAYESNGDKQYEGGVGSYD